MKLTVFTFVFAWVSSLLAAPTYEVSGGYFRLESERGIHYCKSGSFFIKNGRLVHDSGLSLTPPIRIDNTSATIQISENGFVSSVIGNRSTIIGRLVVARFEKGFSNPGDLFQTTTNPQIGNPREKGFENVVIHLKNTHQEVSKSKGRAKILVRGISEVSTPSFTIGQIATIEAPALLASSIRNVEIGVSPRVSADRALSKATIEGALRRANLSLENIEISIPERAIVRRESRMLSSEELEEFGKKWLSEQSIPSEKLSLNHSVMSRKVPVGNLEMRVRTHRETNRSHVVAIEGMMDGESLFVTQLVFVPHEKSNQLTPEVLTLKSGDTVRVLVVSNGLTVETMGKVRRPASVGETVVVTINDTKADLTGIVRPDGTVEVKL